MSILKGVLIDVDNGFDLRSGYLVRGKRVEFEESRVEFKDFDYYFSKSFFNAHTHLGDSVAKDPEFAGLIEIVAPGGYKHRILSKASVDEIRKAVLEEVRAVRKRGTLHFLDFREGGMGGIKAVEGIQGVIALGRPQSVEEAEKMNVSGFGMSSTRDHDMKLLEELREIAKRKKLIFAIHAGERDCGDVEAAISLEPDIIVHMNSCVEMLPEIMEREIPIISCPRSNAFFGLMNRESYEILSSYNLWMLGSDNAMISKPCMLEEMHFASYILRRDYEVLIAATRGYEVIGKYIQIEPGYVVFNRKWNFRNTRNPLATLVRRACCEDIEAVIDHSFV